MSLDCYITFDLEFMAWEVVYGPQGRTCRLAMMTNCSSCAGIYSPYSADLRQLWPQSTDGPHRYVHEGLPALVELFHVLSE